MKMFVVSLFIFCFLTIGYAEVSSKPWKDSQGYTCVRNIIDQGAFCINFDAIKSVKKGVKKVWIKFDYNSSQTCESISCGFKSYTTLVSHFIVSCDDDSYYLLTSLYYDAQGNTIASYSSPLQKPDSSIYEDAAPNTIGDIIIKMTCDK